jgi:hypothetical protein
MSLQIGEKMKSSKCKICGKIVEGFTQKDLDYKMIMHNISHRDKSKEKQKEVTKL